MRFITEFELWSPFEIKNYKGLREKGSAEWLGMDIAKAFGWDKKDGVVLSNPTAERHTIEIEAFPMDKWILFKRKLFFELEKAQPDAIKILEMIKELESAKEQKEGER